MTKTFCFSCQKYKATDHFSVDQLAVNAYSRRCPECIAAKAKALIKKSNTPKRRKNPYGDKFINHMAKL